MWLTQRCGQGVHSGVLSASTGMRFWGVIILMISRKRAAGCGVIPNLSIESVCGFTCREGMYLLIFIADTHGNQRCQAASNFVLLNFVLLSLRIPLTQQFEFSMFI